ncbi:hypothetical protein H8N03_25875 [Ramlibacter sp. USB13]|uniref:Uncharacterized protein n=1 Tax=Ramlibacter cellulosilyticus TaxID=2764187 RepID=A0A923MXA8_9BURK|nr:hypothetical protein [Ramlibacter cellulosilyticus]MBC5786393.1 hypothetical protein [Ramlibacter cellulosilyticus]
MAILHRAAPCRNVPVTFTLDLMSSQRDVSQQNAGSLEQIGLISSEYEMRPSRVNWLRSVLASRGIDPTAGLLVRLQEVPEQEGQYFRGTWLTTAGRFWDLAAMLSRDYREVVELDEFDDVTEQTLVSAHVPGTGKSFGYLALEALRRRAEA